MINARLDVPPDWTDKSMLAYSHSEMPSSGVAPNVVVTRDALGPDLPIGPDRIVQFAENQLLLMESQLRNLRVQETAGGTVAGFPAVRLVLTWLAQQVPITQIVVFIEATSDEALIATGTCATADYHRLGPELDRMIQTLQPIG